jgi:uncharacterized protein with PQ loop repeat
MLDADTCVEYMGLAGGGMIAISFIPQTVKILRTGHAEGVSPSFIGIMFLSNAMMILYGVYFSLIPVIIANASVGLNSVVIMFYLCKGNGNGVQIGENGP